MKVIISDPSSVKNMIYLDFRQYEIKGIYPDLLDHLKILFREEYKKIETLFSVTEPVFRISLEQEKRSGQGTVLASFNAHKSTLGEYFFHIYYDSVTDLLTDYFAAQRQYLQKNNNTVLHELLHAADLKVLGDFTDTHAQYNKVKKNESPNFWQMKQSDDIQWLLLIMFKTYRAEGIAIMGENLLGSEELNANQKIDVPDSQESKDDFLKIFCYILQGLSNFNFYDNIEKTGLYTDFEKFKAYAYLAGDAILAFVLKEKYPDKNFAQKYLNQRDHISDERLNPEESLELLEEAIKLSFTDYIKYVISYIFEQVPEKELLLRNFYTCCAVIQNEDIEDAENFSEIIANAALNGDYVGFINILTGMLGYPVPGTEIKARFESYPFKSESELEQEIKKMAADLLPEAVDNDDIIAKLALTYLFDNTEMIRDDLPYLGLQDDWMVLKTALRLCEL